ncbi:hypothetical protein L207DRAFT_506622 [Hyaloscypha variabilis F]|uniref:Uncharacterized protein n=1 Tax=Hyaloscypha variabilis (strain UAMH 11265 / GT02V1 / F) TaxID=1149755 RepID=A0A2J6SA51_HYAVF|nr:hypothetical protein L207DRAFT_506622 [Hyaloscypha variabilis F]
MLGHYYILVSPHRHTELGILRPPMFLPPMSSPTMLTWALTNIKLAFHSGLARWGKKL